MSDWIGLGIIIVMIVGALVGLRALARPKTRTADEFERSAAEGTTMMGATMNALQEMMNPEATKSREVITQLKEGRYQKKRKEGKTDGSLGAEGVRMEDKDER